jgi:hypothetical protein
MPPMRKVLLMLALVACGGDDDNNNNDAATGGDARPVLALNCQTYCDTITAACTGANGQYQDPAHCTGTCNAFTPGAAATETSGDTLGCRIYHAQNAMLTGDVATHCPHAGPVGAKVDAATGTCGTDPCSDFCALDAKVCGTDAAPVTGVTNRYTTVDACKMACANFDKMTAYSSTAPNRDTLACRINHLTNAAANSANVTMWNLHCGHTLANGGGVCINP